MPGGLKNIDAGHGQHKNPPGYLFFGGYTMDGEADGGLHKANNKTPEFSFNLGPISCYLFKDRGIHELEHSISPPEEGQPRIVVIFRYIKKEFLATIWCWWCWGPWWAWQGPWQRP